MAYGAPATDRIPPERRTIRGHRVQASRKRLENEHAVEEAAAQRDKGEARRTGASQKRAVIWPKLEDDESEG